MVGLRFGRFGREDGALLMVTQGGALVIKILKRTVNFEPKETKVGAQTVGIIINGRLSK